MRVCIHRGTREIGGTCVEVESSGQRILLDLGLPLNAIDVASTPLPAVAGLAKPDPSLLAIVLSHGHRAASLRVQHRCTGRNESDRRSFGSCEFERFS